MVVVCRDLNTVRINRRIRFIVKWSPLLLAAASVWLFVSLRQGPLSIPYLITCAAIGLLCGGLIILDFWKDPSPLMYFLSLVIFFAGEMITQNVFFPGVGSLSVKNMSPQYFSTVLVSALGLVLVLRQRIIRYIALADVEEAPSELGRE